jgi:translocation and assembly module TamB
LAVTGSLQDRSGSGEVHMTRRESESYTLAGDFQLDSVGGEAHLTEMVATLEERTWSMARPTWISWTADVLGVEDLEVIREGDDPMRLTAAGTLAREGESDFQLDVDGLHLERLGAMLRNDPLDIAGHLDLRVRVRGPAPAPLIDAELEIEDPRFRNMTLSRVEGTMSYRDRAAAMTLGAWDGERQALTASGTVPVDLSLGEVASRRLDEPMDLVLAADSLDAGLALAYFGSLEDVVGVISADVQLRGTTENPIPSGQVRLEDGAWTMEALGVRHRNVSGSLDLREDQTVTVDLSTTGTGTSTVTGTIRLSPLDDPSLDLTVSFDRFRAMERRDIEGTLSGDLTVTGTYQRPLTEGTLTVDEGLLQVDEFSRAAGVVDLSDPRLFSQGLAVDTTVFMSQRILADIRNPFLDNLRLNVNLSVPRNTWLRSNEMNVEMGGDLLVRYDRSAGDLVLVGELQALRGTYLVLGRTFEVDEGIVSFIGRPGINPSLDIAAVSRFRTSEGGQVAITATVDGTLVQPRVTLTSEAGELSQSDLISYLVFNQSAAEVGRAQQSFLGQATGGAAATAVSGVVTFGLGSFVNQSGAAIAQELSLDYVAVSSGPASAEWAGLRSAQLELGRYLGDDVFAVVTFRPLIEEASRFGGVRIEWALTDVYNFEAFVEDRFLRSGVGFLGIQELGGELLYGVLFAREWSYNQ